MSLRQGFKSFSAKRRGMTHACKLQPDNEAAPEIPTKVGTITNFTPGPWRVEAGPPGNRVKKPAAPVAQIGDATRGSQAAYRRDLGPNERNEPELRSVRRTREI